MPHDTPRMQSDVNYMSHDTQVMPSDVTHKSHDTSLMQSDVTYTYESRDSLMSHTTSADVGAGHVTGTREEGAASAIEGAQSRNETQTKYADQEQNQDHHRQIASSEIIESSNNRNHPISVPPHPPPSSHHHQSSPSPPPQGGEPSNRKQTHSDSNSNNTAITQNNVEDVSLTSDIKQSLPDHTSSNSCPDKPGVTPVIISPKRPQAVNTLKRHVYETYSSDDDDVFLPNPPSKSQADKCTVTMGTEVESKRVETVITITMATPEKEKDCTLGGCVGEEEPLPDIGNDGTGDGEYDGC